MKTLSSVSTMFLMVFIWTISPLEVFAQNSRLDWSAFGSGFEVPGVSNTVAKSSVGQPFVGSSQLANSVIESGFLANPLLRGIVVGVNEQPDVPTAYSLSQNYPNPFNPSTTIRFELPRRSSVELSVFNMLGQKVATLLDEERDAGRYSLVWHGTNDEGLKVGSGVYFYRIRAEDGRSGTRFVETKKLLLLK